MNSKNLAVIAVILGLVIAGSELVLKKAQSQNPVPDTNISIPTPDAKTLPIPNKPKKDKEDISPDDSDTPEISPDEIKPDAPKNNNRRRLLQQPQQRRMQPYAQPYGRGGCCPPGQPYGGQPYGGQPYGGQPYGGQPYGEQ